MLARNPYHNFMTKVSNIAAQAPAALGAANAAYAQDLYNQAVAGDVDALDELEGLAYLSQHPPNMVGAGIAAGLLGGGIGGITGTIFGGKKFGRMAGAAGGALGIGAGVLAARANTSDPDLAAAEREYYPQLAQAAAAQFYGK